MKSTTIFLLLLLFGSSTILSQPYPAYNSNVRNESVEESVLRNSSCSTWRVKRGGWCKCGVVYAGSIIQCSGRSEPVKVLHGYCITHPVSDNFTFIVGTCQYNFMSYHQRADPYYSANLPVEPQQVDHVMCGGYNRTGQLCGDCESGLSPPVFTYHPQCVPCPDGTNNWGRYLAISLLPQALFFLTVLVLRLRATSSALNGFILYSQLITPPPVLRTAATILYNFRRDPFNSDQTLAHLVEAFLTFHSVWNMDFFRLVYDPFCLTPNSSILRVLALDYLIAVGPLIAITLTYILVKLHYYNCPPIVWIWRGPLQQFSAWFTRSWNPRTSLVDAFATFLLLSYIKCLSVSFTLLFPAIIFEMEVERIYPRQYLYYASTTEYLGHRHLPYAVLAVLNLAVFTVFPVLLLCLYPCRRFQRFLNSTGLNCQTLYTFMDTFQGPYKNGTVTAGEPGRSRDYRYFAAGKLLLMAAVFMSLMFQILFLNFWATFWVVLIYTAIFAVCRPFRQERHNNWHIFWLALTLLFYGSTMPFGQQHTQNEDFLGAISSLVSISIVPLTIVYALWILIRRCLRRSRCPEVVRRAMTMSSSSSQRMTVVVQDPIVSTSSSSGEEEEITSPLLKTA